MPQLSRLPENMNISVRTLPCEGSYSDKSYLGQSVWDAPPKEIKWRTATYESAKNFCFTANLHGVKYLAEPCRPICERCLWLLVLMCLLTVAVYLIWITSISDLSGPLLINLESSNYPIWKINFPAVTICPSSKLNKTAAEVWAQSARLPPNVTKEELVTLLPNLLHLIDFAESAELSELQTILELNNVKAHELYLNLSVSCRDLLVKCRLNNVELSCPSLFKTIRTSEGYCCSFNYFGVSSQFLLNLYHQPSKETPKVPLRLSTTGKNTGISIVVRSNGKRFGTLMASQGVKVLLHVASNFPDHLSIQRLVQPGNTEDYSLHPTVITAGSAIREIDPSTRNCYFFDEHSLPGFQQYSYKSCIFNCRVDFYVKLCGCVPFYYPARSADVRTCGLKDVPCLNLNKYQIQTLRINFSLELDIKESAPCGCRPQCNEVSYEVTTSSYSSNEELKKIKLNEIEVSEHDEFSTINVYYMALYGTMYQRVQHSTTYQMLANFGGLLGLFMGFSFIAAFEVIYSFTLRIFFRVYVTSKQTAADEDHTQVQPFK